MKKLFIFTYLTATLLSFNSIAKTEALFSPQQGKQAFNKIFDAIKKADNHVYVTIYSWSISGLEEALLQALDNGADVRIVIKPSLASKLSSKIKNLEASGAYVKKAFKSMHEKFVLVDRKFLMNTSANMSNGARSKYSENFIYVTPENKLEESLVDEFYTEFEVLWNSGRDIFTHNEPIAPELDINKDNKTVEILTGNATLFSSSQNFNKKENDTHTKAYKKGQYISMSYSGSWKVHDMLIKNINQATKSIYLSLNHFNLSSVADALIEAVKRGVDVRLAVDNQYLSSREVTIRSFIKPWYKLKGKNSPAPVRVKYYSLIPSPRYWYLNHHKYLLIDYKVEGKTKLISGSHNISKTAETKQMDNMVVYEGKYFQNLYKSFYGEFENLWNLNRNEQDLPKKEYLDYYKTPSNGTYRLHAKTPISLTHEEVLAFQKEMKTILPEILEYKGRKRLYKNRNCYGYNPSSDSFVGCN